jgi:hypothetical protein
MITRSLRFKQQQNIAQSHFFVPVVNYHITGNFFRMQFSKKLSVRFFVS